MTITAKKPAKKPAKTVAKAAGSKVVRSSSGSALRGIAMSPEQLHRDMVAYGKKVTATKASALAFLKRIGAPV
jgi:hypothetical protein